MDAQAWAYGPAPRPRSRRRRSRVLGAVVGFVVAASAVAVAAWVVTVPTGSGFSKASQLTAPTIASLTSAEVTGDLFPGGNGDLSIKVTNPNTIPIQLVGVNIVFSSASSDKTNCVGSAELSQNGDATFKENAIKATAPIVAGATTVIVLQDIVKLSSTAATECQGALFTVPLQTVQFATV